MATVFFNIGSTDWAGKISDIQPQIKETKPTATSVKGETRPLLSRSTVGSSSVRLVFPYLDYQDMSTFQRLAQTEEAVTIDHNLDVPKGTMTLSEFQRSIVKVLDSVLYRVEVVFTSSDSGVVANLNPQVPATIFDPSALAEG
ncbi:MAG: hypothetical protein MZW92_31450 [Comamonadaceae bacterium]|nr:hypothetical protein [Comamonadaceae bacterium]